MIQSLRPAKFAMGEYREELLSSSPRYSKTGTKVVEVSFFESPLPASRFIDHETIAKEYKKHNLKPADLHSFVAINREDKWFCMSKPNGTQWQNKSGEWCVAEFYGKTGVIFYRWFDFWFQMNQGGHDHRYNSASWFAGIPVG